ncbi:uncharacterized protein LOC128239130 isoform X2 [Mya arenaria]|uniref:uncharacterized protein LOC128239130 isoform X2 n=1 Tax=Mya arenaria TaxID=6604 RepID=UPI0022E55915|nr:uncharacterized protein LOC128239130 isoform X2 [Mya arenaria]
MEVPGKKLHEDGPALDAAYCQPCSQDGETLPAEAYCTVCKELLCSTCVNVHKKQKMLKSHTLLDRSCRPTTLKAKSDVQTYTELCDIHPEELIKYFCPSHQTLNCGHCLATDHRACPIDIIADISEAFKDGQEYRDMNQAIALLIKAIKDGAVDVESRMQLINEFSENEVLKIREYRVKVNKYFAERESSLLEIIEQTKMMDISLLDSLKTKFDNMKDCVEVIKTKLEAQERNTAQLFIEAKRTKKQLESLQSAWEDIDKDISIHRYEFKKDLATEALLASCTGLGTVKAMATKDNTLYNKPSSEPDQEQLGLEPDVPVKGVQSEASVYPINMKFTTSKSISVISPSDKHDCWLTNVLLLSEDRILLTDNNTTVKFVDLQTNSLVSTVSLPGKPWGMCLLPLDRVAVSVPHNSFQFVNTRGKLSLSNSIKMKDDCRGIGYHNGKLIVSYYRGRVKIMDMNGNVTKRITNYKSGQHVFSKPLYLTVVNDGKTADIIVSDRDMHTITKLDMDLNLLQIFQDPALRGPLGINAVGSQLLICGQQSNNIICLDMSSGQVSQPLGKKEGILRPYHVCSNQQKNRLYVTCNIENFAKLNNTVKSYKAVGHFKSDV